MSGLKRKGNENKTGEKKRAKNIGNTIQKAGMISKYECHNKSISKPKDASSGDVQTKQKKELTLDDILRCGLIFDRLDKDHDGRLNASDITKAMQSIKGHPTAGEVTEAIHAIDLNGDGTIDFQEFLTLVQRYFSCLAEDQELRVAFRILDRNSDGFIDANDLQQGMEILGIPISDEEAQAMIKMGDRNNDEFTIVWKAARKKWALSI